jgi:hypothetical protein
MATATRNTFRIVFILSECYDFIKMGHVRHACNLKGFYFTFFSLLGCLAVSTPAVALSPADTQESHPGLANESRYAEAIVAYHRKQTKEALKILDELIKDSPKPATKKARSKSINNFMRQNRMRNVARTRLKSHPF